MAFNMKTWVDRITEYPTRRRLRKEDGSDELVTVSREEGQVSEEGDAFSAENMNDLESRIDSAFKDVNNSLVNFKVKDSMHSSIINPLTKTLQPNSSYIAYTFGGGDGIHGTGVYTKIWLIRTRDVEAFIIPIKDDGSTTTTISIEGLSIKIKSNTNLRMGIDKIS